MAERLPNFIFGAIYRSKGERADASASAPRFKCYTPAISRLPQERLRWRLLGGDTFGRVDPGLDISPILIRKEALGPIINTLCHGQRL